MKMIVRAVLLSAFVCLSSVQDATASGERTNIPGLGMGGTFVAGSRGLDCIGINPGNLAQPERGIVSFSLIPFGVHVGSDIISYDVYNQYFTGVATDSGRAPRYLADAEKSDILSHFDGGAARTMFDADARLFGISLKTPVGVFAFTVNEHIGGLVDLPRDYAEFILYGNRPGTTLDFSTLGAKALWTREYAVSYGRSIPKFPFFKSMTAGVTAKYVAGYAYYGVERFNTTLQTASNGVMTGEIHFLSQLAGSDLADNGIGTRYGLFPEPAGTGIGFDLGASGQLTDAIVVGLSITDIGSIGWNAHLEEVSVDTSIVVDDPLNPVQRDAIENTVSGQRHEGKAFSTSLPTTLRMGVAVEVTKLPLFSAIPGRLIVAMDYNQGFVDVPGTSITPRVSLGMEYRILPWIPVRTGVSVGGSDHTNMALGFGLNFGLFDLNVGSDNIDALLNPDGFSRGSVALGMQVRI